MDAHIRKVYVPMTETGFYILLCLQEEMHGYNIVQKVEKMTEGEIRISPGTMYGSLGKMEKDGLIIREEYDVLPPKVEYFLTDIGYTLRPVVEAMQTWGKEYKRLRKLMERYKNEN